MAVNYTDFEKIWASTSPLTPYSFSDANYKRGWDFVGSTPPSRQMWDAFMQNADEKLQYLYLHEDVPVGHEYFTFNPNVPQGSLPLFGGEYSRETYSALWAWVQEQTGYLKTEAEWQALAASNNGNVPYYSDGDGSTTFRVPALKCYIKAADGTVTEVGSYYAAGLPNITGYFANGNWAYANGYSSGAFTRRQEATTQYAGASAQTRESLGFNIDASNSNSIYGNSNTVTPETVVGMWLVKAYGVIQDTGTINEQQYIDDRLGTKLSVNGGTMYAPISFNTTGQIGYRGTAHSDNATILRQLVVSSGDIDNWNDGNAKLALHTYSADNSSEDGSFNLLATDGTNNVTLQGKPDGDLKWNGKNIERVNANGSDYIRFESGLQICWGSISVNGGTAISSATCTFPVSFGNTSYTVMFSNQWSTSASEYMRVETRQTTHFTYSIVAPSSNGHAWFWLAIGYWK